jgi:hypothetical protein
MTYGKKRTEREFLCRYEVCNCGHPRADHGDVLKGIIKAPKGNGSLTGHGVCMIAGCPCEHYTWTPKTHQPTPAKKA